MEDGQKSDICSRDGGKATENKRCYVRSETRSGWKRWIWKKVGNAIKGGRKTFDRFSGSRIFIPVDGVSVESARGIPSAWSVRELSNDGETKTSVSRH